MLGQKLPIANPASSKLQHVGHQSITKSRLIFYSAIADVGAAVGTSSDILMSDDASLWLHMAQESLGIPRKTYFYLFLGYF